MTLQETVRLAVLTHIQTHRDQGALLALALPTAQHVMAQQGIAQLAPLAIIQIRSDQGALRAPRFLIV